jgi:peptidoglycan hydrolase-like protein with peptidoglycan-binding domain
LTKRNWAKIQKQLKNAGYSPGAVDGKPGPQTLAALRSYERDFGLDRSSIRNVRASTLESLDAYC